jgi:hypothetical protein
MVSVLTSSAVNCVFESWLCMQHERERAKTGWIETGIVRVELQMYMSTRGPLTVVSVSWHYENPTKY